MTPDVLVRVEELLAAAEPAIRLGGASPGDAAVALWWSSLVEPGDAALGLVEQLCGREAGLRAFIEADDGTAFVAAVLSGMAARNQGAEAAADGRARLLAEERLVLAKAWERWRPRRVLAPVERAIATGRRLGATVLVPGGLWPASLDDLGAHRPACLWAVGEWSPRAPGAAGIAIVGARAASGYGEHCAMEIAAGVVDGGGTVISGGAYGIDGAAHRIALAAGGRTVAVLAGGVDRFYPSGNRSLLEQIALHGAVLGESPPGTAPSRWRFLMRNRIIAALSAATVVVEAGRRSGALNTAHHALALGRAVGAVPGPVTSPSSAGCHALIREAGAVCVTTPDEVWELVDGGRPAASSGTTAAGRAGIDASRTPDEARVVDALPLRGSASVDELAVAAGMAPASVMAILAELELGGHVARRAAGWVRGRSS